MSGVSIDSVEDHPPDSRDESGTAPSDRRFRPDVEGLRAVAIVLVVLYHGNVGIFSGGYIGVDVFFVISGFVIAGLLLREHATSGRTSLGHFYARRSRRIIPAATLVIVTTVVATYGVLGALYGNPTAVDAKWTALFVANFHFAATGSNYLTATEPPSPLLNFWSLAVEEQFYLVFPAMVLLLSRLRTRISFNSRFAIVLVLIIGSSFWLSIVQSNSTPTLAYFSPFTRAWELALGALVAVGTTQIRKVPANAGAVITWVGLGMIGWAAISFGPQTVYPGSVAAIPVVGASLVIAGGVRAPRRAAESVLGLGPVRWIGRMSYSLYLWHWPILMLAAESDAKSQLPFHENVVWLLVAFGAAVVTYHLVENPIRHARLLAPNWLGLSFGVVLITLSLSVATAALYLNGGENSSLSTTNRPVAQGPLSSAELKQLIRSAPSQRFLPKNLWPPLSQVRIDFGGPPGDCWLDSAQDSMPDNCIFGDPQGVHTVVLYGDSHAGMWFEAMNEIATAAHWKLIYLGKASCPAPSLPFQNPKGWGRPGETFLQCERFREIRGKANQSA